MTGVRELQPEESGRWDAFVDASPQGSLYAKSWYLAAVDARPRIFVVEHGEAIQGGLILPRNEIGHVANPMLTKYLGVLLRPVEGKPVHMQEFAFETMRELVPTAASEPTFDCTFHPAFSNWMPFFWAGFRQETRYTFRLHDLASEDALWGNLQAQARQQIRRAERDGVVVEHGVAAEELARLVEATFRRQGGGSPIPPARIVDWCGALAARSAVALLGTRNAEGRLTAACALAYDEGSSNLVLNGIDPEAGIGDNMLLLWAAIRHARTTSSIFDFEGSMLPPVARVYRKFGGELTPFSNIWMPSLRTTGKRWGIKLYKKLRYGK